RQRQLTLVHGDYSPKNILVHGGRLILLDHEVIHWGDPTFDLGFALTHLLSKAHHLRQFHRQFYQAASTFIDVYAATVGPVYWDANLQAMAVRHTLGCMLARVAGRSTLEYLSDDEKRRQQGIIVELMQHAPPTIEALAGDFIGSL
ncbi:MAG TPA: phosphotransferase, partial [Tepidisphaeraceae bacterium]